MNPTRFRREPSSEPADPTAAARVDGVAPPIDSRVLFRTGASTVEIAHGDNRYVLRVTRDNKLILTK